MRQNQTNHDSSDNHSSSDNEPVLGGIITQFAVFLFEIFQFTCQIGDLLTKFISFIGNSDGVGGSTLDA